MTYKTLTAALLAGAFAFTPAAFADNHGEMAQADSAPDMSMDNETNDSQSSDSMSSDGSMASESGSMDNPTVGGAEMDPSMTIVENASNAPNLTTLVSAVQAADLVETLSGEGPFTVFAPTNEAFEALPDGTVDTLLQEENKQQLTDILTYHVVPTEAMSDAIGQMIEDDGGSHEVTTVNGATFSVAMEGEDIVITDGAGNTATVVTADVDQSNGVVHVIDAVLMPSAQ